MICEVDRSFTCSTFEKVDPIERKGNSCLKIFIEGPQGSGKSTLTQVLSELTKTVPYRGFPSSREILSASTQAELCFRSQEMSAVLRNGVLVFDRSPISQFVFQFRHTRDYEYLICAERAISLLASQGTIMFIFIEPDMQACLSRENTDSKLKNLTPATVQKEIEAYRFFRKYFQNVTVPNVQIVSTVNCSMTDLHGFLEQGRNLATGFIDANLKMEPRE